MKRPIFLKGKGRRKRKKKNHERTLWKEKFFVEIFERATGKVKRLTDEALPYRKAERAAIAVYVSHGPNMHAYGVRLVPGGFIDFA